MDGLIPRHWQHFALRPVVLLSEGRCPLNNVPLIDMYCSMCECKWELSTFKFRDAQMWRIRCTKGSYRHEIIGDEDSLIPLPFPG